MPDGLRLALTTLTVAPVRGPATVDRRTGGVMMALAPLVGLLLGLVATGVLYALREGSDSGPLLPAAAAVLALAVLTRGLHLDGLTDTADGLASYQPPEQAREVMKSPGVGALGVATLVLVLLTQVAALSACVHVGRGTLSLLLAVTVARLAATAACTPPVPAATPDGLGALVAGTVRRGTTLTWAVGLSLPLAAWAAVDDAVKDSTRVINAGRVVLAVAVGLLVARALRAHCVRRLGGVNGDVLGALIEVTTLVVLVVMSLTVPETLR